MKQSSKDLSPCLWGGPAASWEGSMQITRPRPCAQGGAAGGGAGGQRSTCFHCVFLGKLSCSCRICVCAQLPRVCVSFRWLVLTALVDGIAKITPFLPVKWKDTSDWKKVAPGHPPPWREAPQFSEKGVFKKKVFPKKAYVRASIMGRAPFSALHYQKLVSAHRETR